MCTVTIVPHAQGFRLMCNRDEQRTRAAALPPAWQVVRAGARAARAVFPRDPQGGGTWIGANEYGLVVALLNRSGTEPPGDADARPSRGVIVRDLMSERDLDMALQRVGALNVSRYRPFHLVVADRSGAAFASAGSIARLRLWSPLMFTSSSLGDGAAERMRRPLFDRLMSTAADRWLEAQSAFHRHQWHTCPDLSVLMSRADAATVSRTTVDVSDEIQVRYEDLLSAGAGLEAA
jgi:uncharacterized protein with NRDE domain